MAENDCPYKLEPVNYKGKECPYWTGLICDKGYCPECDLLMKYEEITKEG